MNKNILLYYIMPPKEKKPPAKKAAPKKKRAPPKKKNETGNVVHTTVNINLEDLPKPKRKAPRRKRQPKKDDGVSIISNIPPTVIYQQAPQAFNVPPPPPTPPNPPPISMAGQAAISRAAIPVSFTPQVVPDVLAGAQAPTPRLQDMTPSKGNRDDVNAIGDPVNAGEFSGSANFISPNDEIKSYETPDKVYTNKPETFKSDVAGNNYFGEDYHNQIKESYPQRKRAIRNKKITVSETYNEKLKPLGAPPKGKRGRPTGSKNKPKAYPPSVVAYPMLEGTVERGFTNYVNYEDEAQK